MPTKRRPGDWELKILPSNHDMSMSWFILLEYLDPITGRQIRKQYRNGINYIKSKTERLREALSLRDALDVKLKGGWRPTLDAPPALAVKPTLVNTIDVTLEKALASILLKSNKERTHNSYKSHFQLFKDYLLEINLWTAPLTSFTYLLAAEYQDSLIRKGFANKTINTKVDFANGLFKWCKNKRLIFDQPFEGLGRLEEPDVENEDALFTKEELATIKAHLLKSKPELWQFYLFIYYCYMRSHSIVAIQLKDINLETKSILIEPNDHKNGKRATKQLLQAHLKYLIPYLKRLKEEGVPADHYLFSRHMLPGAKRVAPTRFSEAWKVTVKDSLGITKNAYQGKHTGGTDYLENNDGIENLKWLQNQMDHSDLQTTSIYVNKRRKIKLDESRANIPEI